MAIVSVHVSPALVCSCSLWARHPIVSHGTASVQCIAQPRFLLASLLRLPYHCKKSSKQRIAEHEQNVQRVVTLETDRYGMNDQHALQTGSRSCGQSERT